MDSTGEQRWRRSGYPLQAPQTTSEGAIVATRQPLAPSLLEEKVGSSLDQQHAEPAESNNGSAPWYHAVTNFNLKPVSTNLELAVNSNNSSLHPVDDVPTTDDSSTAVSVSHRSASPSVSRGHMSSPEARGNQHSSPPPTRNTQQGDSQRQTQWSRNTYPLQAPTEATTEQSSPPPSPQQERDQSPQHASTHAPNTDLKAKRTLRRTPRSRRIQLRASNPQESYRRSQDSYRSTSSTESIQKEDSVSRPVSSPWKRQKYPLQSPTSSSTAYDMGHESPDYETESAPSTRPTSQHEQSAPSSPESAPWRRRTYPGQSATQTSTNLPASPPSSDTDVEKTEKVAKTETVGKVPEATAIHPRDVDEIPADATAVTAAATATAYAVTTATTTAAAAVKKSWQRRGYPLQSPASNANLRSSPTPPPSPKKEVESTCQTSKDQSQVKLEPPSTASSFSRKGYPLQSPASIPQLQVSPPEESKVEETVDQDPKFLTDRGRNNELASKVIKHWRRQVYPVQMPRNDPFQRAPTPQPPEERPAPKGEKIHLPKHLQAIKDSENPPSKGKTIIVCLDGTGDKFDDDNSNIVHLISALKKDDPNQVSYYQAGIGTYNTGGLSWGFSAAADMAVGAGLGLHVRDAYHFLMHTYKEGDRICIFGFSRGAYTARCLAGMIHKVGLLPPRNLQQIPFAYEFYAKDTPEGWKQSEDFKRTFSIDVNVYFIGCFDSVASVGFIPRQLPLSTTPYNKPHYFRHAMALDERRAKFKVCRHQSKNLEDIDKPESGDIVTKTAMSHLLDWMPNQKSQNDSPPEHSDHPKYGKDHHPNVTDEEYARLTGHEAPFDTDVLEVWFAGAHADVGGGAVPNKERHKLAQIPLRWMVRQAFECNTGIIFKTKVLAEFGLDIHTLWPKYGSLPVPTHGPPPSYLEKFNDGLPPRSIRRDKLVPSEKFENGEHFYQLKSHEDEDWTPEQVEDFFDAMSPLNDQLIQAPSWWILEAWPVQYKVPVAPGEVLIRTGMNLGRYRGVDDVEPNVHWTVLQRAHQMGYKILARTAAHTNWHAVS